MNNVNKKVKKLVFGLAALTLLALPVGAHAETAPSRSTNTGIIVQNPSFFSTYMGDVSLIYPQYATELRALPAKFQHNVKSIQITSSSTGAPLISAVVVNGTHIKFTSSTALKVKATVWVTHNDGSMGYYSLSSTALY